MMGKVQSLLQGKMFKAVTPTSSEGPAVNLKPKSPLEDHILGTIYGNCIGDAIGLMTEFLDRKQAHTYFAGKHVEYPMKELTGAKFLHQWVFHEADWTDDSDQMILILQSLIDNDGKFCSTDFAAKLLGWLKEGFPELGDTCGMGVGNTTWRVLNNKLFKTDPHKAAEAVWLESDRNVAPNGGVMRTSILGVHRFNDIDQVISNTKDFCKVTHADPRCVASCVAVTTAISMMLQGMHRSPKGEFNVSQLTEAAFEYGKECLLRDEDGNIDEKQIEELHFHMNATLEELHLDDKAKIGYTFKCLGAGFWALRQKKFRDAIQTVMLEGGDADTNGAVAGALLGCKLGSKNLPASWRDKLKHKNWLDTQLLRYFKMDIIKDSDGTPVDEHQDDPPFQRYHNASSQEVASQGDNSTEETSPMETAGPDPTTERTEVTPSGTEEGKLPIPAGSDGDCSNCTRDPVGDVATPTGVPVSQSTLADEDRIADIVQEQTDVCNDVTKRPTLDGDGIQTELILTDKDTN